VEITVRIGKLLQEIKEATPVRTWQHVPARRLASLVGAASMSFAALTSLAGPASATLHRQSRAGDSQAATQSKVEVKAAKLGKYGNVLVDEKGLALYYNTANKPPKHWACTGKCLTLWPPLVLPKAQKAPVALKGVSGLGAIKGPSGMQVTWHGKPLYTFAADKADQAKGEGVLGIWFLAGTSPTKPSIAKKAPPAKKTTTTTAKSSYGGY
jgi:predicted lipoprotein with Yx(FWY)xxD motif